MRHVSPCKGHTMSVLQAWAVWHTMSQREAFCEHWIVGLLVVWFVSMGCNCVVQRALDT